MRLSHTHVHTLSLTQTQCVGCISLSSSSCKDKGNENAWSERTHQHMGRLGPTGHPPWILPPDPPCIYIICNHCLQHPQIDDVHHIPTPYMYQMDLHL